MKRLIVLFLASAIALVIPAIANAAGSIGISASPIGSSGSNWLVVMRWSGDASSGAVPATTFRLTQYQIAGYQPTVIEVQPGSPAPTNNYSLKIADPSGVDILGGAAAASLSSSASQGFTASTAAPPLDTFTVTISGQSVAGAQGAIYLFLTKPNAAAASTVGRGTIAATTNVVKGDSLGNAINAGFAPTAAGIVGLFMGCSSTQYLGADGACHAVFSIGSTAMVLKGDSAGNAISAGFAATGAGIASLFSGCSGTQYLGADGACHTASALSGLTSTRVPKATSSSTVGDSSVTDDGTTVSTPETISTGVGSGNAGAADMAAGTVAAVPANSFGIGAGPTMTTSVRLQSPNAVPVAHSLMVLPAPTSNNSIWAYKAVPDCQDSAGNHINFTQSTDAFSCGTTSSGGGPNFTTADQQIISFMGSTFYASANQTSGLTANTVYCFMVPAQFSITISKMVAFLVNGAQAGKSSALGIYNASGTLLQQGVVIAPGGQPQVFPLGASQALIAGTLYYFCAATEDANSVTNTNSVFRALVDGSAQANTYNANSALRLVTAANPATGTAGTFALPPTLGALTVNGSPTANVPYMFGTS